MLLTPPRQTPKQMIARTANVPAPVGGLNGRDALAAMPPTDAVVLTNWFPQPSYVGLRNGSLNYATGLPAWVETLMDYKGGTTHKMFAVSGTAVFDVTNAGPVNAAAVTGLSNARWEWTNIETPAGQFLYAANATDSPLLFNGSTWTSITGSSSPAITGVATTKLRNPVVWKNRLWFVEDGSTRAWYLPIQSIGGAASAIDIGTYLKLGGTLQAILTVTLQNGSTFDDYIGFLSSEGELLLYAGSDPSQAGLFFAQGRYRIGQPIGRRCWFRYGDDAIVICADGFQKVSAVVAVDKISERNTLSYKILNLVNNDVQAFSNHFGWEGAVYPLGNKVLINVPQTENAVQYQYVMNTISDAWCVFTGWNAATFLVSQGNLFYGGNGVVVEADTGFNDNGASVSASMQPAFSYFGTTQQKHFKMVRPVVATIGNVLTALALNVDFQTVVPTGSATFSGTAGSPWDISAWDSSLWAPPVTIQKNWQSAPGIGFAGTVFLTAANNAGPVNLQSIDYLFEPGGVL
jgi:hypothetical protein